MTIYILKKKKSAHAYFEHRIFSKFFGGKIHHIGTDVTYRINNTWRMRPLTVHICLSFFGGKILTRKSPWNNNFPLLDLDLAVCSFDSKSGTSVLYLCMDREKSEIFTCQSAKKKNESKWKIINHKLTYGKNIIKFIFSGDNNLKLVCRRKKLLCDYTNQRERNLGLTRIWWITDEYSNKFEEFGWSCRRKQWLQERNYNLLLQIEFQLFICSISGIKPIDFKPVESL